MTRHDVIAAGRALFGPRFQTDLAAVLAVNIRTVQRWCSGAVAVPADKVAYIAALLAHDEWIVGEGADTLREFIVHTRWPRFTARVVAIDCEEGEDAPLSPLVLSLCDSTELREIVWTDPPPDEDGLQGIIRGAYGALEKLS